MRVTKAIREYVEDEIYKKYNDAMDKIGSDYYDERNDVCKHVIDIMNEAAVKAEAYAESRGFVCTKGYRNDSIFYMPGNVVRQDEETRINEERNHLREKMRIKTKQVLFDLEMGDTAKAELKDVLDNITID